EWPVAVVAFGGEPALEATGEAAAGEVDTAPVDAPPEAAARGAGDAATLGEPWARGAPVDVAESGSDPVEQVVLARSSQRRMDPAESLAGGGAQRARALPPRRL